MALSQEIGVARNKLQALESGKTVNPIVGDLVRFSAYFKVSIDTLIKIDFTQTAEPILSNILNTEDTYLTGSDMRVLAISVDQNNRENIEYVPIKAKAGYQTSFNDPEYIACLPKFTLPNLPGSGTFRMFPTTGDSMLPIPENSDVIGQYVADWKSMRPNTPCIVILKDTQDFVFKLVSVQTDGKVLLRSLNPNYQPYTVGARDILEIWKYYKHQTATLPESPTGLGELKEMILELGTRLPKINGIK